MGDDQDDYVRELMATPKPPGRAVACAARGRRAAIAAWSSIAARRGASRACPNISAGHVAVSVTALLLGLAVSLPLAVASIRRPVLRRVLLGVASVVQTIPGLALLALFYPLLLGVAALSEAWFGTSFSALGFLPSVLALRSTACCRCCGTPSRA
jgi:ABC-type proline/glycine betaine transport system permease subunit